ncbi:MAG: FKBP-type peptidyl-prolyl cis-trans isomerase [Bacteroidota bacterium]
MRKLSYLLTAVILFSACQQNFKKGEKGLEYKIISSGSGAKIKVGDFMQMQICQYLNDGKRDSLLNDTRANGGPIIEPFDANSVPPEYYKILSQLKNGDSAVIRLIVDSMFAKNPGTMPPFIKKGYHFITTIKLLNIFNNQKEVDSARQSEMIIRERKDSIDNIAIMQKDDKTLQDYFKKNNITGIQKTPLGTYVQIIQPGTGANIDTSVIVKTNYTGRTMDGKMFDSNTDSSKGHVEPLSVNMTNDMSLGTSVIKGWTDGLKLLNKGAKAKFYIPSPLAYGKRNIGEDIPANSILVFDIEIMELNTKEQVIADMNKKLTEGKLKREKYMDSVKNLKAVKTKK